MPVALVTGGSAGLGRELVLDLAATGWSVITDGRRPDRLAELGDPNVTAVPGDVTDEAHRDALVDAVDRAGWLDLLVHNASDLGPAPLPRLVDASVAQLHDVWRTNVAAPFALTGQLLPRLVASRGVLLSISSDAGVEHYPGWGVYGSSKAGLDHVTLTFGAENPEISAYAVDPGDMRTAMHQAAFPGEDISDRPVPATVVPRLRALLDRRPPSGRYRAADIRVQGGSPVGAAR